MDLQRDVVHTLAHHQPIFPSFYTGLATTKVGRNITSWCDGRHGSWYTSTCFNSPTFII